MKLDEFMNAHEGEAGMAEKLTPAYLTTQGVQLSDEELELTTGGGSMPVHTSGSQLDVYRKDEKGRTTHWRIKSTGQVYYYACPRCKRVTHLGLFGFVYCDPCDTYWNTFPERRVFI